MKDIPENVLWLLVFANLGCKAGQIRQWDVSDLNPPVKRPPVEPPSKFDDFLPEKPVIYFIDAESAKVDEVPISKENVESCISFVKYRGKKDKDRKIKDKYIDLCWKRDKKTKKPKYLGQGEGNPTFKEFTDFFYKTGNEKTQKFNTEPAKCPVRVFVESCRGILPAPPIPAMFCRDNVHKYFIKLWENIRSVIMFTIRDNEDYISVKEMYEISKSDAKLQNHPIPKIIYNALFDFLLISSGGLFQVKQCACCGIFFWIKENTNGKPKTFCCVECNNVFNKQARHDNAKSVKINRGYKRKAVLKRDYPELVKFIMNEGHSEKDAHKEVLPELGC